LVAATWRMRSAKTIKTERVVVRNPTTAAGTLTLDIGPTRQVRTEMRGATSEHQHCYHLQKSRWSICNPKKEMMYT
jgi:hypothetical protein